VLILGGKLEIIILDLLLLLLSLLLERVQHIFVLLHVGLEVTLGLLLLLEIGLLGGDISLQVVNRFAVVEEALLFGGGLLLLLSEGLLEVADASLSHGFGLSGGLNLDEALVDLSLVGFLRLLLGMLQILGVGLRLVELLRDGGELALGFVRFL